MNGSQSFFKEWNHDMAYVLGLWFAVGTIYNGSNFDITLRKKDKYILKKVAKFFNYNRELTDAVNKQIVKINFFSKEICNDILRLSNKNKSFPKVPKKYLPDFIRGYFDGNGCVMNLKDGRLNSAFFCESKEFADSLLNVLKEEAGIQGGSFDDSRSSLKFGKRDSLYLGVYIYKNNPELFLLRKKQKFFKEEK